MGVKGWHYPHIERMVRELRLLRAECEAWRKAAETMPKQRSAADHDHEHEGKWDWTGETCDECALWIAADEARKATAAACEAKQHPTSGEATT